MDTYQSVAIATLIIYKAVLLLIGVIAQRRTHDNTDYFLGGRALGPLVASISYGASSTSAWVLLGYTGFVYSVGFPALWFVFGTLAGHVVGWFVLAPRLQRMSRERNLVTTTDILADGTSGPMRTAIVVAAAIMVIVSFQSYVAGQFQGAGVTFSSLFGLGSTEAIVLGGIIVAIYTILGGFWAVSLTDTLQGMVIFVLSLLLPIMSLVLVGGPAPLLEGLRDTLHAGQLSLSAGETGLAALGSVVGILSVGMGSLGQPHLITRFMALRDERALRQARIISLTWFALIFTGMFILGLCAHLLLPPGQNPEAIFFSATEALLHPVFAGVAAAAVLSAVMSTADSQLLVTASAIAHDLGMERRFPRHALLISRLVILAVSAIAVLTALAIPAALFERVLFAWVALGCAFGPTVLFRALQIEVAPGVVLVAILTGFTLAVGLSFTPHTPGDVLQRLTPLAAGFAILILGRLLRGRPRS